MRSVGKETATTTVSVPLAAGAEAAREDRNRVGGPKSSRAPRLGFFFFLKLEDSNACYLPSPLFPGHARALSPHSAKTHISPTLDHPEGMIWEWH